LSVGSHILRYASPTSALLRKKWCTNCHGIHSDLKS